MGKRGRAAAMEKYSFGNAIQAYLQVVQEVASENVAEEGQAPVRHSDAV
jgi:hypothetical protein